MMITTLAALDPASVFALALMVGVGVFLYFVGRGSKGGKKDGAA